VTRTAAGYYRWNVTGHATWAGCSNPEGITGRLAVGIDLGLAAFFCGAFAKLAGVWPCPNPITLLPVLTFVAPGWVVDAVIDRGVRWSQGRAGCSDPKGVTGRLAVGVDLGLAAFFCGALAKQARVCPSPDPITVLPVLTFVAPGRVVDTAIDRGVRRSHGRCHRRNEGAAWGTTWSNRGVRAL